MDALHKFFVETSVKTGEFFSELSELQQKDCCRCFQRRALPLYENVLEQVLPPSRCPMPSHPITPSSCHPIS